MRENKKCHFIMNGQLALATKLLALPIFFPRAPNPILLLFVCVGALSTLYHIKALSLISYLLPEAEKIPRSYFVIKVLKRLEESVHPLQQMSSKYFCVRLFSDERKESDERQLEFNVFIQCLARVKVLNLNSTSCTPKRPQPNQPTIQI